jgi:hypothetical protein
VVFGAGACGSACKPNGMTCTVSEQCCSRNCDREAFGTCGCALASGACSTNDDCCGGHCTNGRCTCGEELARCTTNADCCTGFTCQRGNCLPR